MEASKEKRRMIAAELKAAFGAPAFAKLRAASTAYRGGQTSAGALCAELYGLAQLDGALVERAGAFQQAQLHAAVAAHSSTPTLRQPAAPAVATQLHAVSTLSSQLRAAVVARCARRAAHHLAPRGV